ncbi:hypothetical protein ACFCX0_01385 [Streptomyces sp. NPDC056352]|uniref:hypothetical protein n=1 Tax=Streptomyces sp. NPDC056352 TaxID=3345791 RepID=UPI0035DC861A
MNITLPVTHGSRASTARIAGLEAAVTGGLTITPRGPVGLLPPAFESDYISGTVKPYLLDSQSVEERPPPP